MLSNPHQLPPIPDLSAELRTLVLQIPVGRTAAFGEVARAMGDLKAARWVATEAAHARLQEATPTDSPQQVKIPWHRLVRKGGEWPAISPQEQAQQAALLIAEGVRLQDNVVAPTSLWSEFQSTAPLRCLAEWQQKLAKQVVFPACETIPEQIAAVDLSYQTPQRAVAAYVEFEVATRRMTYHKTLVADVFFPYISGYLTFRELPPLLQLLQAVRAERTLASVLLVDGAGVLHPRRQGIATALGVIGGYRTVGVTKHYLYGRPLTEPRLSWGEAMGTDEEWLGASKSSRSRFGTMYISPGSGIDVPGALAVVESVWDDVAGPLPITAADRLSRAEARRLQRLDAIIAPETNV